MDTFFLDFRGIWRNSDRDLLPNLPGVYCVYRCNYDLVELRLVPSQLLYIGDAMKTRDELHLHEDRSRWESMLRPEEELGFTYAPILKGRGQAAAALAFRHRPAANASAKHRFPFRMTAITLAGKIPFLDFQFFVPDLSDAREGRLGEKKGKSSAEDRHILRFG